MYTMLGRKRLSKILSKLKISKTSPRHQKKDVTQDNKILTQKLYKNFYNIIDLNLNSNIYREQR